MMESEESFFAYGDDAGFVSIPASRERAKSEAASGMFNARASLILEVLRKHPDGLTWKDLSSMLSLHHGQVSGALSNLHRKGFVFMLHMKRQRCHPYVHVDHIDRFAPLERIDEPSKTSASAMRELEREILRGILDTPSLLINIRNNLKLENDIARYRRLNGG
jgi:hypothetical protein